MKKTKKRYSIILLILCFVIASLCACGENKTSNEIDLSGSEVVVSSKKSETSVPEPQSTEEPVVEQEESNAPHEDVIEDWNSVEEEDNISETTWITQMAVDEFGDVTDKSFPVLSALLTGEFSNTATSGSELSIVLSFAQKPGTKHYIAQISLFEYGSTMATYFSDDELILKIKLEDEIYEIKMNGQLPNDCLYIGTEEYDYNADWIFDELYLGNDLRCIINIGNSKYSFTIYSDNFKELCDTEQFDPAGDLENIMTPVDWEKCYFDSEFMVLSEVVAPIDVYGESIVGNVITCWFTEGEDAHNAFEKYNRYLKDNFDSQMKSDGYKHYYDNRDNELFCTSLTNRGGTRIEITINKTSERPEKSIDSREAYKRCKEKILTEGTKRKDEFFDGTICAVKVEDYAASEGEMETLIGAKEDSDNIWLLVEYIGSESSLKGFGCVIELDGNEGKYNMVIPVSSDKTYEVTITGSFEISSYKEGDTVSAGNIIAETHEFDTYLHDYPTDIIPIGFNILYYWLQDNGLGLNVHDLGFKQYN